MSEKEKNPKKKRKWRHHYRMVVLDDDTFEEKFSLKLNKLNVLITSLFISSIFVVCTAIAIIYTPLKEYIPGYGVNTVPPEMVELSQVTDSLRTRLAMNEEQYSRIRMVLSGDITSEEYGRIDSITKAETLLTPEDLEPIAEDSILREEVARVDKFSVDLGAQVKTNFVFFPPVKGTITAPYDKEIKHYAVDIAAAVSTPIKAAADGTVIFSGWTVETGYTILIEHSYGLITVYKHADKLNKEQNDQVVAGEVVATVGNTGELTSGPHLHFEIWSDGYPLDPTNFISFE
jgi:murein DD-endopeptidase MepM/ murein hydrolase activator NlpD